MNVKRSLAFGAIAASLALTAAFSQTLSVNAQGGPETPKAFVFGFGNPCSTTDYTSIAATALGISASDLRVALVSGKTLEDLAAEKGVSIDDVKKALEDARQADLEQAQKDGTVPTFETKPALPANEAKPDIVIPGAGIAIHAVGRWGGAGVSAHNEVNALIAAADAIGVSCPDLVKAASSGKSIVQFATEKNVQVQTVIDAIVKARKDALAKDVAEGLITQAQADGSSVRLVEQVTQMISQPGGLMMWFGNFDGFGGGFRFEFRGNGDSGENKLPRPSTRSGRPNRPGTDKAPDATPSAPDAPPADATPEATPNA
jgi:hypothetical protein